MACKANVPQKIVALYNDNKKWVACFKHDAESNAIVTIKSPLKYWIRKTQYVIKNLALDNDGDFDDRGAKANITLALNETNYKGWNEELLPGEFTNNEAVLQQQMLLSKYEKLGYTSISRINMIGSGVSYPNSWNKKWDDGKAPAKKTIMRNIETIEFFMGKTFSKKIKDTAYYAIVGIEDVGFPINSRGTLYKYLQSV